MNKITVIGAGAWGTALAQTASKNVESVTIWVREPELVDAINKQHRNTLYLPDVLLSDRITATNDLNACLDGQSRFVRLFPSRRSGFAVFAAEKRNQDFQARLSARDSLGRRGRSRRQSGFARGVGKTVAKI